MARRFSIDSGYSTVSSYRDLVDQADQHRSLEESPLWISCNVGDVAFDKAGALKVHIPAKHRPEPSRECRYCGQTFKRRDNVLRHEREQHTEGKPDVPCQRCGQMVSRQSLRSHRASKACYETQSQNRQLYAQWEVECFLDSSSFNKRGRLCKGSRISNIPSIDPLLMVWKLCDTLVPRKGWTWRPDPETGMRTRMMDTFVSQASLIKRLEAYDMAVPAIQLGLSRHRPSCRDIPCAARLYASILLLTLMEACVSGYKNIAHHAGALAKFQDGPFEEVEQLGLQLLDDLVQEDEVLDFPRLGLDCLHTRVIGNDEVNGPARDGGDALEGIPGAAPKFKKVVTRVGRASWEQIVRV